jgi:hypothetical protein
MLLSSGSMRGVSPWWCVVVALCSSCEHCSGPGSSSPRGESEGAEATAEESVAASPRPEGVRIEGRPGRYREVSIAIEAHGPDVVRLRRDIVVERAAGDGFERVDAAGITLRPDCVTEAPECVELAPGAELLPPPWSGALGDAQCECDDCRPAEPGRYRFVATSCDGAHRIHGEPFALID